MGEKKKVILIFTEVDKNFKSISRKQNNEIVKDMIRLRDMINADIVISSVYAKDESGALVLPLFCNRLSSIEQFSRSGEEIPERSAQMGRVFYPGAHFDFKRLPDYEDSGFTTSIKTSDNLDVDIRTYIKSLKNDFEIVQIVTVVNNSILAVDFENVEGINTAVFNLYRDSEMLQLGQNGVPIINSEKCGTEGLIDCLTIYLKHYFAIDRVINPKKFKNTSM